MAKIMLCDDSATILMFLEKRLKDQGHNIVAKAKDGEEGARTYRAVKPEVMLLDVTMPNRDGRDCLKEILAEDPKAKVIMLSALLDQKVIDECMAAGAKGFISKSTIQSPTFVSDLCAAIDKVVKAG